MGLEPTASTTPRRQEPFYLVFRDVMQVYFLTFNLTVKSDGKVVCVDFNLTNAVRRQFAESGLIFPFVEKVLDKC